MSNSLIIGSGNLGKIIIDGFGRSKKPLIVYDKDQKSFDSLKKNKYQDIRFASNLNLINWENIKYLMICVKPKDIEGLIDEIKNLVKKNTLIISFVAGLRLEKINKLFSENFKIVRLMPNILLQVDKSATAAFKNFRKKMFTKQFEKDFHFLGKLRWLQREEDLNFFTALYGGGPAYLAFFLKCLQDISVKKGLKKNISQEMILSLLIGTSKFIEHNRLSLAELIKIVSSKGGTTEEAIKFLKKNNLFLNFLEKAMKNAEEKSKTLSKT
ncbi:MAG: hypothetical protein CMP32_00530 [Rickettsiales bacterium]|nr:hypothetical protein [Rickettsiales bacterium]